MDRGPFVGYIEVQKRPEVTEKGKKECGSYIRAPGRCMVDVSFESLSNLGEDKTKSALGAGRVSCSRPRNLCLRRYNAGWDDGDRRCLGWLFGQGAPSAYGE